MARLVTSPRSIAFLRAALAGVVLVTLGACGHSVLPSTDHNTDSPWQTFAEAKQAYDQIELGRTTLADLQAAGYDPDGNNIKLLSYLEVQQRFLPNEAIAIEDLDPSVQVCLAAHTSCIGIEAEPEVIKRRRIGNAPLDLLNFHRETLESGWKFSGLVLVCEGIVVFKTWTGVANIMSRQEKSRPLGPLQDLSGFAGHKAADWPSPEPDHD